MNRLWRIYSIDAKRCLKEVIFHFRSRKEEKAGK
jgi:hypothetical protein